MEASTSTTIRHLVGLGDTEAALRTLQAWAAQEAPADLKNQCLLVQARWEQLQRDHIAGMLSEGEVDKRVNQINSSLLTLLDNSAQRAGIPAKTQSRALSPWIWLPIVGILALFGLVYWVWHNKEQPTPQTLVNAVPSKAASSRTQLHAVQWPEGKVTNVRRAQRYIIRYEIIDASIEPFNNQSNKLTLNVRCQNGSDYGLNFWDSTFRLLLSDQQLAPSSGLNETIDGGTRKDGIIWFEVPKAETAANLQITGDNAVILPLTW